MSQQQTISGLVSVDHIVGNKKKQIEPIIPISKTTFFNLIKKGLIPPPFKILARNYYHVDTVKIIVEILSSGAAAGAKA